MQLRISIRLFIALFICSVVATFVWFTAVGNTGYLYALYLESKWSPANPKTMDEFEQFLNLYTKHEIKPQDSLWGNGYKLKDDERMVQYLILGTEPLDVVYDSNDRVKVIFTSYE